MEKKYLTWIELSSDAFRKNIATIRTLAGKRKIAAAVKANAYGHGLKEMIALLDREDVEYVAVHSLEEAAGARKFGWQRDILIVGYISLSDLDAVFDLDLEPTVYNAETIGRLGKLAEKYGRRVQLHLKVETGTNRQGVELNRLEKIAGLIKRYPNLHLYGVSTHFANIEDTTNHEY
ncbi:MAG: alanine racemase, partial [Candidatus Zixiibacteriota bacterium]